MKFHDFKKIIMQLALTGFVETSLPFCILDKSKPLKLLLNKNIYFHLHSARILRFFNLSIFYINQKGVFS